MMKKGFFQAILDQKFGKAVSSLHFTEKNPMQQYRLFELLLLVKKGLQASMQGEGAAAG